MTQKPMSLDEASRIAKKGIAESHELVPTQLSVPVYNFDPEGWAVFYWIEGYCVGGTNHCAVNLTTGEFRYLGEIGE